MKVLVLLAVLCLVQTIAGQLTKEDHKVDQQNQGDHINKPEQQDHGHVSGQQTHKPQLNQLANNEQQVAAQNQQHVGQNVNEHIKPNNKVQPSSEHAKVSVEIPSKVQQVVTQVSQHIPQVVLQHVASQQRMVRSIKNRLAWQDMQVNAAEQRGKCKFLCNQQDLTVCGYNGRCHWEFESQCDLSTYNCLNTDKIFHIVDFAKCQDISAAKCYRGDL